VCPFVYKFSCRRCQQKKKEEERKRERETWREKAITWAGLERFVLFVEAALCGWPLTRPTELVNNELGRR
jgi:hypothetical protein